MGGPAVTVEMACCQSELCAEWKNMKIFEGLTIAKKMIVNVIKLLNVGVGRALRRKGGKKRCERNEQQI
jgi:hypothetical protein